MIMLHTSALLWWCLDPGQLSERAAHACREMEVNGGLISSISIWEIGSKVKKGKLEIGLSIEDFVARLDQTNAIEIVAVDEKIWLENLRLEWDHSAPADRTIVATARLRRAQLVTSDRLIQSFYGDVVW